MNAIGSALLGRMFATLGDLAAPEPPALAQPAGAALAIVKFMRRTHGDAAGSPEAIEALWLAMQLLAGPAEAARTLRACALTLEN